MYKEETITQDVLHLSVLVAQTCSQARMSTGHMKVTKTAHVSTTGTDKFETTYKIADLINMRH
jgi:hypothetical protein